MMSVLVVAVSLVGLVVLFLPRVANARLWRATVTPLASIIGSGFLVLGPILNTSFGHFAPLMMAGLCVGAFLFGSAIRFNIAAIGDDGDGDGRSAGRSAPEHDLETASSWALAFAYFISVAYYLNLFGAFAVSLTPWSTAEAAHVVTSAVLIVILAVGWRRGFSALEHLEQVSVGLKLAIIGGLLVGLGGHFVLMAGAGELVDNPVTVGGTEAVTLAFGLLVTVQGFETSRYLGDTYDAKTRIRSMLLAQGISTLIYLVYLGFLTFSFHAATGRLDETAIIDMMAAVAPVLPVLLVVAALSAQFSAAIADTSGAGGLISELTAKRAQPKHAYAILVGVGLGLTWTADVFHIISYASRAFAVYYALQAGLAAVTARRTNQTLRAVAFGGLAALAVAIAVFGTAVE